jgi:hypothetical protein
MFGGPVTRGREGAARKITKAVSECDEYHKFYFNQRNPNLMARQLDHC